MLVVRLQLACAQASRLGCLKWAQSGPSLPRLSLPSKWVLQLSYHWEYDTEMASGVMISGFWTRIFAGWLSFRSGLLLDGIRPGFCPCFFAVLDLQLPSPLGPLLTLASFMRAQTLDLLTPSIELEGSNGNRCEPKADRKRSSRIQVGRGRIVGDDLLLLWILRVPVVPERSNESLLSLPLVMLGPLHSL